MDIHAACWKKEQRCQDNRGVLSCKGFSIRLGRNMHCCWPSVETNNMKRRRHWIVLLYFWELTLQPRGPHVLLQSLRQGWSSWLLLHHPHIISNISERNEIWLFRLQPSEDNSLFPRSAQELTITLQPLPCKAPEQSATVITKCWALVVVDFEAVRHVNLEPLLVKLQQKSCVGESLLSTSRKANSPQVCTTECGKFTATLFLTG